MSAYTTKPHAVEVLRIIDVGPLIAHGKILAPAQGLRLVLENGTQHNWLSDADAPIPAIGDFLVQDRVLHTCYTVTPAQLNALFATATDHEIRFESIGGQCISRSPLWAGTPEPTAQG